MYISHPETFKNHTVLCLHPRTPPRNRSPPPGDLLQSPASASRLDPNPWVLGARSHCLGNLLLEDSVPCFCGAGGWRHPGLLEKNRMKPPIVGLFTDGFASNVRLESINDPEIIQRVLLWKAKFYITNIWNHHPKRLANRHRSPSTHALFLHLWEFHHHHHQHWRSWPSRCKNLWGSH